ncbi:unnamed protein product [Tetraodon nigroviridis]|uniref:(spotted green pufferfish) hypothetical protein n=1 Tax=Tetraodon nigroviridis TaxID=99883 RepID=Q4SU12_TETNG|nr:unnamed protein product [Tetraodon nigroviridis]
MERKVAREFRHKVRQMHSLPILSKRPMTEFLKGLPGCRSGVSTDVRLGPLRSLRHST